MLATLYTCLLSFASRPPNKTVYATGTHQTDWPPQCNNDCASANDGVCDDGSPTGSCGSGVCACGSDCNDCGLSACAEPLGWGPDKVHGVDGWTRMEGGGQAAGGSFAYGAFSNPPGYTYHHGAAQTCARGAAMWYNNDGRTCNKGGRNQCSSCTCDCQYGVCPMGYEMNVGTGDSGYWSGGDYGNRRRYPYPKGHFYPDQCPCKLATCPDAYILTNGRCIPRKCRAVEPTQSGQSVFAWVSPKVYKSGKNPDSPCGAAWQCPGNCWDDRLCGNPSAVQVFAANYAANTACGTANQCAGNCFRARECGALPAGQLYKPVATPLWPGQTYDANMACGTQSDCNSKCSANRVCGSFSDVSGAGVTNVYCTNNNPHAYSNQASAAACQATCDSDTDCKYVVHWQDGGCQRFSSATGCTVGQSTASWTADAKIYQCEPAAQQGLCGEPPAGKMFKIFTFPTPWNLHGTTDMQPAPTTTEASLGDWGAFDSSGCFETGKVCVGDRTVMEAKAEQCVWVTGNLQAHRVGFPDPDAEVELPYLKRIGDISPTGGGVGDMTVLYSVGNSGKLEVLKMPNLLRVEGSFRVEANRDPHPLPLAKYTDFKIRVVEAPKLTYANRVTVYDTPELETLKLDALKYDATRLGQWHLTRTAP